MTALDLYALSSGPDLQTLEPLEGFGAAAQGRSRPPVPQRDRLTDCSALVRILPSGDVLVGHDTWAEYWQMLRIYKIYHLSFTAAGTIAFSSYVRTRPFVFPRRGCARGRVFCSAGRRYPAMLASSDDFYVTRATQLAVIETTNSVFNMSLLYEISPLSMFTWQRAMAATYNAASGAQWTAMFATSNSGTYNNQWYVPELRGVRGVRGVRDGRVTRLCVYCTQCRMIFDAKKWVPNATATLTDVLWITEQLPLLMHAADVTDVLLARGYWASYNVPYFQDIYNVSGYLAQCVRVRGSSGHRARARTDTRVSDVRKVREVWRRVQLRALPARAHLCAERDVRRFARGRAGAAALQQLRARPAVARRPPERDSIARGPRVAARRVWGIRCEDCVRVGARQRHACCERRLRPHARAASSVLMGHSARRPVQRVAYRVPRDVRL